MLRVFVGWIYRLPMGAVCLVTAAAIILWADAAARMDDHGKARLWKWINAVYLLLAIFGIFYTTLFSRVPGTEHPIRQIPFYTFYLARKKPELYREMFMNVLLFVPFGMSFPWMLRHRISVIFRTVLTAAWICMAVEIIQVVFRLGQAEVDDLICNSLGALIGSLAYVLYMRFTKQPLLIDDYYEEADESSEAEDERVSDGYLDETGDGADDESDEAEKSSEDDDMPEDMEEALAVDELPLSLESNDDPLGNAEDDQDTTDSNADPESAGDPETVDDE